MGYIGPFILLAGAILAVSGFIIAKKPEAKALIDKIVPYQGFIGVALLAWGIIDLLRNLSALKFMLKLWPFGGAIFLAYIFASILLGVLLGIPQIVKWIPGESSAEQKAMQVQQKVAGFSVLIGLIGGISAILVLLIAAGILKP